MINLKIKKVIINEFKQIFFYHFVLIYHGNFDINIWHNIYIKNILVLKFIYELWWKWQNNNITNGTLCLIQDMI